MLAWISYFLPDFATNRQVSSSTLAATTWKSWSDFGKAFSSTLISCFNVVKQAIMEYILSPNYSTLQNTQIQALIRQKCSEITRKHSTVIRAGNKMATAAGVQRLILLHKLLFTLKCAPPSSGRYDTKIDRLLAPINNYEYNDY